MTLLKLVGISVLVALLSACQTPSITYTGKAIGDNREIKLPIEVITQDKPAPTIIVAHPSDGVNLGPGYNRYVKFWGSVLKSWGYNVVVPDSFTPRGYKNREVMYNARLVNYYQRAEDLEQVAAWIKQQPWHSGKIGAIGFSHGGGAVNRVSNTTSLISAGVAFIKYSPVTLSIVGISFLLTIEKFISS
jgi:predicted alpha/beta-fold hydrolase